MDNVELKDKDLEQVSGGSIHQMKRSHEKTKHRKPPREENLALRLKLCPNCHEPKLPHIVCPNCGYSEGEDDENE